MSTLRRVVVPHTLMASLFVVGSVAGYAASILIDPRAPLSQVSVRFFHEHRLPCTVLNSSSGTPQIVVSGLFVVRSSGGELTSSFLVGVSSLPKFDAVLGSDWTSLVMAQVESGCLCDPTLLAQLPRGQWWLPIEPCVPSLSSTSQESTPQSDDGCNTQIDKSPRVQSPRILDASVLCTWLRPQCRHCSQGRCPSWISTR